MVSKLYVQLYIFVLLKSESKRSIFQKTKITQNNVEEKGDIPLSILNNFYILCCLGYSQTIFCLYIASYLIFCHVWVKLNIAESNIILQSYYVNVNT